MNSARPRAIAASRCSCSARHSCSSSRSARAASPSRSSAWRSSRDSHCSRPATTPAAREARSTRRPVPGGCRRHEWGPGQPGGDVVTGDRDRGGRGARAANGRGAMCRRCESTSRTRGCRRRRAHRRSVGRTGRGCRTARRYGRAVCRDGRHRPRDGRVADLVVGVGDAERMIGDGGYDGGATRPRTADRLDRSLDGRIGLG